MPARVLWQGEVGKAVKTHFGLGLQGGSRSWPGCAQGRPWIQDRLLAATYEVKSSADRVQT